MQDIPTPRLPASPDLNSVERALLARVDDLEALLHEAKYILANNELEGDATAGRLVSKINHALKRPAMKQDNT